MSGVIPMSTLWPVTASSFFISTDFSSLSQMRDIQSSRSGGDTKLHIINKLITYIFDLIY